MNDAQVEQVEITIAEAKKVIGKAEALRRLQSNADFKLIFNEGYLKDEAVRLVLLKSHPEATPEMLANIDKDINSIGSLFQHLRYIMGAGNQAMSDIEGAQEMREEIHAEEGSE